MSDTHCEVCVDGMLAIPFADGDLGTVDFLPCPCCRPWAEGFVGLHASSHNGRVLIISASAPNEPARYVLFDRKNPTFNPVTQTKGATL